MSLYPAKAYTGRIKVLFLAVLLPVFPQEKTLLAEVHSLPIFIPTFAVCNTVPEEISDLSADASR